MLRYTTPILRTIHNAIYPLLILTMLNSCLCKSNPHSKSNSSTPSNHPASSHQTDQGSNNSGSSSIHTTDPTKNFHKAIRKIEADYQANKSDKKLKTIHQALANLPSTATPNEVFTTIMGKPHDPANDELPVIDWLVKEKLLDYKQPDTTNKTPFETLLASWESTPNTNLAFQNRLLALGDIIRSIVSQLEPTEQADNLVKCIEVILNKLEKGEWFRMEYEALLDGTFRSNSITVRPEKATKTSNRIKNALIYTNIRDYLLLFVPAEYRKIK